MREFSAVSAVAESQQLSALVMHAHRVIAPLPDASSDEPWIPVHQIPVFLQPSGAVAHRVPILAHEIGTGIVAFLPLILNARQIRIHAAHDVHTGIDGALILAIRRIRIGCALVVHRAGGVAPMHPGRHRAMVVADLRFVSQRPDDDAGEVLIPLQRALHAVHIRVLPSRVAGKGSDRPVRPAPVRGIRAMRLDVAFIHHVKPIPVAKLVKTGVIRIVGGAHTVDVVLLHHAQILLHILPADRPSLVRMRLVPVDAAELDRLSVDQQFPLSGEGYRAEPELRFNDFSRGPDHEGIQRRRFCCPARWIGNQRLSILQHRFFSVRRAIAERRAAIPHRFALHAQMAVCPGMNEEIPHMRFRARQQVDIPEDTVIPVGILVLQIGPAGPGKDHSGQRVLARLQQRRQVEFGLQM